MDGCGLGRMVGQIFSTGGWVLNGARREKDPFGAVLVWCGDQWRETKPKWETPVVKWALIERHRDCNLKV